MSPETKGFSKLYLTIPEMRLIHWHIWKAYHFTCQMFNKTWKQTKCLVTICTGNKKSPDRVLCVKLWRWQSVTNKRGGDKTSQDEMTELPLYHYSVMDYNDEHCFNIVMETQIVASVFRSGKMGRAGKCKTLMKIRVSIQQHKIRNLAINIVFSLYCTYVPSKGVSQLSLHTNAFFAWQSFDA